MESSTAEFDLTQRMSKFLDVHMVLHLLQMLEGRPIYDRKALLKAKLDLLAHTNMAEFEMEVYQELHGGEEAPEHMAHKRERVLAEWTDLKAQCAPLMNLIDEEGQATLKELLERQQFTAEHLKQRHGVTEQVIDALYRYAKFQMECGMYADAATSLRYFRALVPPTTDKSFSALWGLLAATILSGSSAHARDALKELCDTVDKRPVSAPSEQLMQLQQRSWLLHWALFIVFDPKAPDARDTLLDLCFPRDAPRKDRPVASPYLIAISQNCPWLLRYLTVSALTSKSRRNVIKDLVRLIKQEREVYRDPITEFVEALYLNFDFETAQHKLRLCQEVLQQDVLLCRPAAGEDAPAASTNVLQEFMENARMQIFETYCRIHERIELSLLAEKLAMPVEEAERWMVGLMRRAKLDAKIDSQANHVVMRTQYDSIYDQVLSKTRDLALRTGMLATHLDRAVYRSKS